MLTDARRTSLLAEKRRCEAELRYHQDRLAHHEGLLALLTAPGTSSRLTSCESPYSDSVDISGAFEVVDTRVPPVWQAVMDLPPGACTITLSVWEDDEVVCIGSQTLAILEDQTTINDIVLVCSLSIDTPDGMADVDGTLIFVVCPDHGTTIGFNTTSLYFIFIEQIA